MVARSSYPMSYIGAAQARIDAQVAAFDLVREPNPGFESIYFNNMVIVLDSFFANRMLEVEGRDGNALNEVRMLVASMTAGDSLVDDPAIKYKASSSILGLAIGAPIAIMRQSFAALASAFFVELEKRFGAEDEPVEAAAVPDSMYLE